MSTMTARDVDDGVAEALRSTLSGARALFDRRSWLDLLDGGWLHMLVDGGDTSAAQFARRCPVLEEWGGPLVPGPVLLTVAWLLPLLRMASRERLSALVGQGRVFTATREATDGRSAPPFGAVESGAGWLVRGRSRLVPWLPDVDEVVVTARDRSGGTVVASVPTSAGGVQVIPGTTVDPGISVGDLVLDGAVASSLVEVDAAGHAAAGALYSLALDAQAVGGSAALLHKVVRYVSDRRQFGQPVGSFQAVKHQIADMLVATEAARSLLWLAADRFAAKPDDPPWEEIDASRICAAGAFRRSAEQAIQCHGGTGFTWEEGLHLYYRRALVAGSLLGNVDVAARRLVANGSAATGGRR